MSRARKFDPINGERIIITGVGRSGTTFLVQLFSALEFETGYTVEEALSQVDPISFAGLEQPLFDPQNPYVVKSPYYAEYLMEALDNKSIKISYVIVPIRSLFEAAESRRRVTSEASKIRPNPIDYPGGLTHTLSPDEQEEKLAINFYGLIHALVKHRVGTLFLEFPRLVNDGLYCFEQLRPLLDEHGVDQKEFLSAHGSVANPHLIHIRENMYSSNQRSGHSSRGHGNRYERSYRKLKQKLGNLLGGLFS